MITKSGNKLSEKDMAKLILFKGLVFANENLAGELRDTVKVMTEGQLEKVQKFADAYMEKFEKMLVKGAKVEAMKDELGL
jgi:hypothetical protein